MFIHKYLWSGMFVMVNDLPGDINEPDQQQKGQSITRASVPLCTHTVLKLYISAPPQSQIDES